MVILRENEKSNRNKIFIAGKPADWLHFRLGSEFLTLTVFKVAMFLFSFPLWGRLVTFFVSNAIINFLLLLLLLLLVHVWFRLSEHKLLK